MIWHDLRTKPKPWTEFLVVTTRKTPRKFLVCYTDEKGIWWKLFGFSEAFIPKSVRTRDNTPKHVKNDFTPRKWAYIQDLVNL